MKLSLSKDLTSKKAEAIAKINTDMETIRGKYLTQGSAMSMVYAEKNKELDRFYSTDDRDPANYPYLMIDANLLGVSLESAASYVGFYRGQWEYLGPITENARRAAVVAVENASNPQEIEEATELPPLLRAI